jgi:hypothetical protein
MTTISELKMHIRDEELRNGMVKTRLKRHFGSRTTTAGPKEIVNPPSTIPSPVPTEIQPTDSSTDLIPDPAASVIDPALSADQSGFRVIVNGHIHLVDDDNTENEPVGESQGNGGPWKIVELFDFTRTHWVETYAKTPRRSFEEELRLYELLDAEEDGVENVDVGIDDATADVLLN